MKHLFKFAFFCLIFCGVSQLSFGQEFSIPEPEPEPDPAQIYSVVEQMPAFPGGEQKMFEFMTGQVRYPGEAKKNKEEGLVVIEFVVTDQGDLVNPKAIKSAGPNLDQEALRIIGLMPQWTPGKQNDRPVNVKCVLPFRFRLP